MDSQVKADLGAWIAELRGVGTFAEGGLWRTPFTESDKRAKALLAGWMTKAGMTHWLDNGGNLIGRMAGREAGPVVMAGSHIDSVKSGGYLDGALGIMAGLAVAAGLKRELGQPKRVIDIVAICGEEQSRFRLPFIGSRAMAGTLERKELDAVTDADGITVADAMAKDGLDPDGVAAARRNDIGCFIELHIEQGPVLEARGCQVGVVTDIVGITQCGYTIIGDADHAGTTPMTMRRDALRAAVKVIDEIPDICRRAGDSCVATVGTIGVKPGGVSSVPAECTFTIDVRDRLVEVRRRILTEIESLVAHVVKASNLAYRSVTHTEIAPTPMDEKLVDLFWQAAQASGARAMKMHSGAGHDAMVMAKIAPAAMLFVPSRGGKSHTPKEFTDIDEIMPGIDVLYRGMKRLAYD
ncbi:MAG: M20 family metallo-hydrolase [Alphaproteobacteria bacterium]|nr:M20 family metallo-hydrolase [Alphaproteobacteria bacterium]